MILRAPEQDFVVRTLAKTTAGDTPLMTGDLVIAGRATRERHPVAATPLPGIAQVFPNARAPHDPVMVSL